MGRVVAVENVTLDGVMQAPARADEDERDGFRLGGWANEFFQRDPGAAQASFQGQGDTVAFLFGRRTYLDLVGYWLATDQPNPFTALLRDLPKYVATRTLDELPHPNSIRLGDDVPAAVAGLRRDLDGTLLILGSGELVRSLAAADLVDEYTLTTLPIVLGSGRRLFDGTHQRLEVTRSVTTPTGIVVASYSVVRDGPRSAAASAAI